MRVFNLSCIYFQNQIQLYILLLEFTSVTVLYIIPHVSLIILFLYYYNNTSVMWTILCINCTSL